MNDSGIDDLLDTILQNEMYIKNQDKLYRELMESIELGDYEYFLSKIVDPLYGPAVLSLMLFSSKIDDIKRIIANNQKYNINSDRLLGLICATKDPEYIMECIEKRKEYGFNIEEVFRLIKATKDSEFMKKVVRNYHTYSLSVEKIRELIKLIGDAKFAMECVDNRKKYGLAYYALADVLILADETEDKSHIKSMIEDAINGKSDSNILSEYDLYNLIKETGDDEYIKSCIAQKGKYKLTTEKIVSLIITIEDRNYADECIKKREEFGFTAEDIVKIIMGIDDKEYIKAWVNDAKKRQKVGITNEQTLEMIMETNDTTFTMECIRNREQLGLDMKHAVKLIKATKKAKFIEDCIEERGYFEFTPVELGELICATEDAKFIIDCLENRFEELEIEKSGKVVEMIGATLKDRRDKGKFLKKCINAGLFNLNGLSKTILIQLYNNPNFTKQCINNAESLGLHQGDFMDLVLNTKDLKFIEKYLNSIERRIHQPANKDIILPSNETIGIEIETVGGQCIAVRRMTDIIAKDWHAKNDGSLIAGAEVTSPILHSDDENTNHSIYKVCRRLEAIRTSSK